MVEKTAIIILGASGDLAKRKLTPALQELLVSGGIDAASCVVVGSGRTEFSDEEFRLHLGVETGVCDCFRYHRGIGGLRGYLNGLGDFGQYVFFFSLPPKVYAETARALKEEGFSDNVRLIVEKPFGSDYASARELNRSLTGVYPEERIYRIDHYLAKETVQNILVFRFANALFEPVWNSAHIDSIEINAFETLGVEQRGGYFDKTGIIRDMVQNHLLQLLSLLMMDPPVSLSAEDIGSRKRDLLKNLRVAECRRYQYSGYQTEEKVANDSDTETFAELKIEVCSHRWHGVPVYIRTGKKMPRSGTEIGVKFKPVPPILYNREGGVPANKIVFIIQPHSGIVINHMSKVPGQDGALAETNLNFCYNSAFGDIMPEAYRKLLLDALKGERTLFVDSELTELAWKKIEPVLDRGDLTLYRPGTVPHSLIKPTGEWIDMEVFANVCSLNSTQLPPAKTGADGR